LQRARKDFEAHGLGIAAITYDNPETLGDFAERKGIDYPLLADPTSETIRRYGLLDPDATPANIGSSAPNVAYPGYFWIDREGVVRERFIDARYDDRRTANGVLTSVFPGLLARESRTVEAPHVAVALSQSDREVVPGSRITLTVGLTLPPSVHVYAHDARGYKPLELALEPSPACELAPVRYPPSRKLRLEVLQEEVPVHEGSLEIRAEVLVAARPELLRLLERSPDHRATLSVRGVLRYQACDDRECHPPCEIPVAWEIAVRELDLERTDPSLRKPAR